MKKSTNTISLINISVPPGELVDKITILEIKSRRVKNKEKLRTVRSELSLLKKSLNTLLKNYKNKAVKFKSLKQKLYKINLKLWVIEDRIRILEKDKDFGAEFIKLARSVYITNDERSVVKNKINALFGSTLNEVKQYVNYK